MKSGYYPPGADTPDAPWNEVEVTDIEVTCHVSVNLVKDVPVMTDQYITECDEEDGSCHIELIASYSDMETEYRKQHKSIPELLNELSKYINGELAGLWMKVFPENGNCKRCLPNAKDGRRSSWR